MTPTRSGEKKGSEAALEPAAEELDDLRAALAVSGHLDLSDQLREILHHLVTWASGSAGFAFVVDTENRALVCQASTLPQSDRRRACLQRLDPGIVWQLVPQTDAVLPSLTALAPDVEWPGGPPPAGCFAVRAETVASEPVALLLILAEAPPSPAAQERVRRLMHLTRRAVANAVQVRVVRDLVIKDDTADCFNRRYFEDFLVEEIARASRFRAPLSLIFFDMDNLKEVNSRLGHAMGSRSLYEVSLRVRSRVRKFDKLFRFGGDEFCIVLPETEWHGALEVAERVRESVAGRPFLSTQPSANGGIRMTASFGVASFPLHARTKEDLVQRADRAMQRIKNGPKNSIAVAEIGKDRDEDGV